MLYQQLDYPLVPPNYNPYEGRVSPLYRIGKDRIRVEKRRKKRNKGKREKRKKRHHLGGCHVKREKREKEKQGKTRKEKKRHHLGGLHGKREKRKKERVLCLKGVIHKREEARKPLPTP